jgi:hypothetical protein
VKKETEAMAVARKEKLEAFLVEYEALCKKHNARIHACGCCSSPWPVMHEGTDRDWVDGHVTHLREQA